MAFNFLNVFLCGLILIGALLMLASLSINQKILRAVHKVQSSRFWILMVILIFFFFISYILVAYFIYQAPLSIYSLLTSFIYFFGACFVFMILKNSLSSIKSLIQINHQLSEEIAQGNKANQKLTEQSQALAEANAHMTKIYIELEETKNILEKKESELKRQNEEFFKMNVSLANANSNITNLYLELEDAKEELTKQKKLLSKQNKYLSKSNLLLADVFKKFVPEQFLYRIAKKGIENIRYGYSERTYLTILFSDLRSFTPIAERLDHNSLFQLLNKYFSYMTQHIYMNGGFVDKFVGDAIMSLFETNEQKNISHPEAAVLSAIGMQRALVKLNIEIKDLITNPLVNGIGIHTGEVILGTVGLENRMDSTVLGNTVNIASRIEQSTKDLGASIIVSEDTLNQIEDLFKFSYRNLGSFTLRGVEKPLVLYEFFDGDEKSIREKKYNTVKFFQCAANHMATSAWEQAIAEYEASLETYQSDPVARYLLNYCQIQLKKK